MGEYVNWKFFLGILRGGGILKLEWKEKKHENSRVVHELRERTNLLRERLIENCLRTLDAKDVQALTD